jgi:predicted secreted hydrolase
MSTGTHLCARDLAEMRSPRAAAGTSCAPPLGFWRHQPGPWLIALLGLAACRPEPAPSVANPLEFLSGAGAGFERALAPIEFEFPRDHGAHPEFQSEWWYLTGHLATQTSPSAERRPSTAEPQRFGLQFTLFRQGLIAPEERRSLPARESALASSDAYLTHVALADFQRAQMTAFERSSRGATGLAGAGIEPTLAFLGPNRLLVTPDTNRGDRPTLQLSLREPGLAVELTLRSAKALVRHGERGLSRKGAAPGNASYYFSATRLLAEGWLEWRGKRQNVSGSFWLDREWSTSVLEAGLVGWDWVSLQFEDGSELMAFVLLRSDGGLDAASSGTFVTAEGASVPLGQGDFRLTRLESWLSPRSAQRYATALELEVPSLDLQLKLTALFPDQELDLPLSYFEGAFMASGQRQGQPLKGQGYVEQVRGGRR